MTMKKKKTNNMEKKKLMIFSGAGVSAESGVKTFRASNGLWNEYKIEDVCTPQGWRKNKDLVLEFYNKRRRELKTVEPNLAHKIIAELEEYFDVCVVTQNVDDLHERGGSTNIVHLHGELLKSRSQLDPSLIYKQDEDINPGDKCERGSQLRPHIVWFNENLDSNDLDKSVEFATQADACIVIGASMAVWPANTIPNYLPETSPLIFINPETIELGSLPTCVYYKTKATVGMKKAKKYLLKHFNIK